MTHPTLYDRILQSIDEELDRLLQARAILVDYTDDAKPGRGKPKPGRKRQRRPDTVVEIPAPEIEVTILPPARERQRRPRAAKTPQSEPRGLASRFPSSPVFVAPPKNVRHEQASLLVAPPLSDFGQRILAAERSLGDQEP